MFILQACTINIVFCIEVLLFQPFVSCSGSLANNYTCKDMPADSPAMDHNGFVPSSPLYHQHMLNDCHDGRRRGAETLRGPAGHLELSHLVFLARLQERNSGTQCILRAILRHEIFHRARLFLGLVVGHTQASYQGRFTCV